VCWPATKLPHSLLTPLGVHRTTHITPSKGRQAKKRKRGEGDSSAMSPEIPPAPELASYVDVGLANVSRNLQKLSGGSNVSTAPPGPKPYSVVFISRAGHSSAFHSHFPQMVAVASNYMPSSPGIRLVGFSKSCEERLSAALGIPRVSTVALREDAPMAKGLVDYVRKHVAPIEVEWLEQARSGQHQETRIDAVITKVGLARPRKGQGGS